VTTASYTVEAVVRNEAGVELGRVLRRSDRSPTTGRSEIWFQWECAGCSNHAAQWWFPSQDNPVELASADLMRHCESDCAYPSAA
jgi:hypothetical protein